ncbi:MAG: GntP family permease [Paracoccaceae bacterium]
MSAVLALSALLVPLALLVALAWRGVSVLLLAPAAAMLGAVMAGEPAFAMLTLRALPAAGDFAAAYLPLFLLGAVFGRVMAASGAARILALAIARAVGPSRAVAAVTLAAAALTYGGVSLFVVAFAVAPLAEASFRAAALPRRLIPAAIALGAFTFTMTALPGSPAIQNAIPMPYFGTTAFAAPGIGLVAGAIMLLGGLAWLGFAARQGRGGAAEAPPEIERQAPRAVAAAAAPVVAVLGLNLLFSTVLLPALDLGYLAQPRWGASPEDVIGLWSLIAALALAVALAVLLFARSLAAPLAEMSRGAEACLTPLFNTAALVGFGAAAASLPGFALMRDALESAPGGPVVSVALSAGALAGITGSASGGMSIALEALGATWLADAAAAGVDPALLHRIVALATGGLDALPHNGAVVTLLGITGLGHREAYGPIFAVAVAIPLAALAAAIALGSAFGAF